MTKTDGAPRDLLVVGANQTSSAMSFRDRLFVEGTDAPAFLNATGLDQVMVLSTGARTDVIAVSDDVGAVINALADHAGLDAQDVREQVYIHEGKDAAIHVFRAAATLDSVMVGDREVLDQLKDAYEMALAHDRSGDALSALINAAAETAERVLAETTLGRAPVSIASSAVQVAQDLHGNLAKCSALLIGGGDGRDEIVVEMQAAGLADVTVAHPSQDRADAIARALGAHTVAFDQLPGALARADIVVCALDRTAHTVTADAVKAAIKARRYKPMFIVDAGLSGDVEKAVDALEEAFVYTPDDLERVAHEFHTRHKGDAEAAARQVEQAARVFVGDEDALEAARAEAVRQSGGDVEQATRLLLDKLKGLWGKR